MDKAATQSWIIWRVWRSGGPPDCLKCQWLHFSVSVHCAPSLHCNMLCEEHWPLWTFPPSVLHRESTIYFPMELMMLSIGECVCVSPASSSHRLLLSMWCWELTQDPITSEWLMIPNMEMQWKECYTALFRKQCQGGNSPHMFDVNAVCFSSSCFRWLVKPTELGHDQEGWRTSSVSQSGDDHLLLLHNGFKAHYFSVPNIKLKCAL